MWAYVFPDAENRRKSLRKLFSPLLDTCLREGEVYTNREVSGIACWQKPGIIKNNPLMDMIFYILTPVWAFVTFGSEERKRLIELMRKEQKIHREVISKPHYYLAALGVNPEYQGKGIASQLLQNTLDKLDQQNIPCYLETETEYNVAFYEKRGFKVIREWQLPDKGPNIWAMIREK